MGTDITRRPFPFDWSRLNSAEFNLVTSLIGVAMRQPDLVIAPDGKPYLYRWYIVPRNDKANVYLHVQVADDAGRHKHDHPWDNQSVILSGGYIEELPYLAGSQNILRAPGDVIHRRAGDLHRLKLIAPGTHCISLFSTGPWLRKWGFMTPDGWVPFIEMVDDQGNYSTLKEAA